MGPGAALFFVPVLTWVAVAAAWHWSLAIVVLIAALPAVRATMLLLSITFDAPTPRMSPTQWAVLIMIGTTCRVVPGSAAGAWFLAETRDPLDPVRKRYRL